MASWICQWRTCSGGTYFLIRYWSWWHLGDTGQLRRWIIPSVIHDIIIHRGNLLSLLLSFSCGTRIELFFFPIWLLLLARWLPSLLDGMLFVSGGIQLFFCRELRALCNRSVLEWNLLQFCLLQGLLRGVQGKDCTIFIESIQTAVENMWVEPNDISIAKWDGNSILRIAKIIQDCWIFDIWAVHTQDSPARTSQDLYEGRHGSWDQCCNVFQSPMCCQRL